MEPNHTPRIEINLAKIGHNVKQLVELYGKKGIEIMGVTKAVCGDPVVAEVLMNKGILMLADSRITNIQRMQNAKIKAQFVLLRTPALSEANLVVKYADISMNTELSVINELSIAATKNKSIHKIILMVEMGDLREGIMPKDLEEVIQEILTLKGIQLVGIGANFACFGGVKPSKASMDDLSVLASGIEEKFSISLTCVTGGNSANYNWFESVTDTGKINNLRIGESIYLGCETLDREAIPELFTDAFTLVAEVIESKIKPSKPYGEIGQDAFGNHPKFEDRGQMKRAIVSIGSQDVHVSGLTPKLEIEILGSSSDHTLIDAKNVDLKVGDEVKFNVSYGALLSLMTSPYVSKKYIGEIRLVSKPIPLTTNS
ncbi:alanine/ornithine racemase family PLP-dependent enzyme [Aquibacillus halophilus]|uniref:Alanine/ornithine racemase family PLP-dependent enzyme n=1 Tax=Aquibacillus halophilus TaxID=930132 RepID=A0A6A8DG63_9BACI|nr:alanine/ornithine racemase family PLP-dependent enzyme [Aquibacillus halophilus]